MQYVILFFEGIITFVSPCLLPMLPIYITYFAAGSTEGRGTAVKNAIGFSLGFTIVFVALGLFAGTFGQLLRNYGTLLNIILGGIVVLFGLSYIGVIKPIFSGGGQGKPLTKNLGFFSAMLFGAVFSVSWTPCVGAFLGSALALASSAGSAAQGTLLLLCYSLGLAVPFILSAALIDRLKSAFAFFKRNYKVITLVSGVCLVLIGVLMMTGVLSSLVASISR